MSASPRISIAIAAYNEEAVVPALLERLRAVLDRLPGGPHQVVIVDDRSTDGTLELLESAASKDPRIAVVSLSRNFGHQIALTAALDHVTGDAVVVMDADLQDPPEAILRFAEKFIEGYDVVYAQRINRKEPLWLRVSYHVFYRMAAGISDIELPLDSGDFAMMSRRAVDLIKRMPERQRYLRGLRAWIGFRQIAVPVERDGRFAGESKYSLGRLCKLAFDGLFAFSVVPLRAAAVVGLFAVLLSVLFTGYAVVARIFLGTAPQGFTALLVVMTFLSGVQLLFLGIVGEYLGRTYEEAKHRPHYVVDRTIGFDDVDAEGSRTGPRSAGNPRPASAKGTC